MLRQYQIKNFKAFADTDLLPIRPITLIYGQNSAGKSSIIQSLMLLKQTVDEVDVDDTVLSPKGKLVDLGNYREFIHLHQINSKFSVRFQIDIDLDDVKSPESMDEMPDTLSRIYKFLYGQFVEFPTLSLELKFASESIRSSIFLNQVNVWIGDDECPAITYKNTYKNGNQGLKVSKIYSQHSFWQSWWEEYSLILPSTVFKQLNRILDKHGISTINKRDQENAEIQLEDIRSYLLEEKEEAGRKLEDVNSNIITLVGQKNELEASLSSLRNHQKTSEQELKSQQDALKSQIFSELSQSFEAKFNDFLASSKSAEKFFEEELGLSDQTINRIKPEITERRLKCRKLEELQRKKTGNKEEPKEIELIKSEIENSKQKIENILKEEVRKCLENNTVLTSLGENKQELFTEYHEIEAYLERLKDSHSEERKPLEAELSKPQEEINKLKLKYTEVPNQEVSNAIENIDSLENLLESFKQRQLKTQFDNRIEIVDFFKNFYRKLHNYSIDLALADFLKIFCDSSVVCSKFLLLEEETADSFIDQSTHFPEYELEFLSGVYDDAESVRFILNTSFYVSSLLQEFLRKTVCVGPMRDYPERFYIFSGNSTKQVGRSGSSTSDLLFREPQLLQKVNDRIKRFDIGYTIKVVSFQDQESDAESDVYAIRLIDDQLKVDVSLLDVGFGISQILPVIVQSMSSHDQTILLEQPEIHIHPRLQTELGDLLIDSVQQFGNRFIVETHSEHLMLRLQRRIREGKLSKDDISVIYVDRDKEGSKCIQLRLNSKGKFIDKWPHGFFDEDIEEIFG